MRMWVIDNLAIKIGALLIALFLWFHAVTEQEYEVKRRVPIEVIGVPQDLILASPIPTEGTIRLGGKGKQLIIPYFSNIRLLVAAAGAERGSMQVTLTPENVTMPRGGSSAIPEIVAPRKLDLDFDTLARKKVPILSRIILEPLQGYIRVGPFSFSPDSILILGPNRYVESVNSVLTDSINYSGVKKPVVDLVNLVKPEGFNITLIPRQIQVTSEVQRVIQRTIEDIPVTLTNIPRGTAAHLEPSSITITISGGEKYLSSLTKQDFSAFADYRRARQKSGNRINARINLPPEVELNSADPELFKVVPGS